MNRPLFHPALLVLAVLLLASYASYAASYAESASEAIPSATPFDSLTTTVESESQAITLLPTVTPTPDHSVLYWPTVEPELYVMATPSDSEHLALRGITYTARTDADFGHFSFNDISPCLCQSTGNEGECYREIEKYILGNNVEDIVRSEQCLSIDLSGDSVIAFNDISNTVQYTYIESLVEINYHLLRLGYWEGSENMLVNGESGAVTVVPSYPMFSPDNHHFVIGFFHGFGGFVPIVQIWSFKDNVPHLEKYWRIEGFLNEAQTPAPVLTWTSAERFQFHFHRPDSRLSTSNVTVALEPEGWAAYYNDKPITQPIVDYRSIRFAYSAQRDRDFLGALEAGMPVYSDRDYLFTSVPSELEKATYFHLPQYFSLGEEPDYFSIEQQMSNYLQFEVTDRSNVYVALDALVSDLPDWMQAGWEEVEFSLETNDIPLRLYRKEYAAGEMVELVPRWMLEDRVPSQFVVIVTPNPDE